MMGNKYVLILGSVQTKCGDGIKNNYKLALI